MNSLDPKALRGAFGSFLTGVTVVTTRDTDGKPHGFTANSFSSVSLDPPLLLVCPGKFLSSFSTFETCAHFAVSILAEDQEGISNIFAGDKGDRFAKVAWEPDAQGMPMMADAAATFSCQTAQVIPAGDHVILLGAVLDFKATQKRGLGYAAGQYFSLGLEREAAAAAPRAGHAAFAGAIVEHDGKVLLEETPQGWRPPQLALKDRAHIRHVLADHLLAQGLDISLGKAFSVFDDRSGEAHYTYFHARAETPVDGALGSYIPIAELSKLKAVSPAHAAMLTRYALEYQTNDFAIYIGDENSGDIHDVNNRR